MEQATFRLRSPTSLAWLASVTLVVATGELYDELGHPGAAELFHQRVGDGVLAPVVGLLAVAALTALAWLVTLYLRPGRLVIDAPAGVIRRTERRRIRRHVRAAPLEAWEVQLHYFSDADRDAGRFKRLELGVGTEREVILFGDLKNGEALAQALTALAPRLRHFEAAVQQPRT